MVNILVLDNYDSFVYTLNGYLQQLGATTTVMRNDAIEESELPALLENFDAVLISPGPGNPASAGLSIPTVKFALETNYPVFGVCLGHQAIAEALGGRVENAPELMHGKTSKVNHSGSTILNGLPQGFMATRYHSLAVDPATVPAELMVTGTTAGGVIMGLRHRDLPVEGVQFHPESVLTEGGYLMLANWLTECGDPQARERAEGLAPVIG